MPTVRYWCIIRMSKAPEGDLSFLRHLFAFAKWLANLICESYNYTSFPLALIAARYSTSPCLLRKIPLSHQRRP